MVQPDRMESFLNAAKILRLGFSEEPYPYIVPLHYGWISGQEAEDFMLTFYMHSAKEGRKVELLSHERSVCVEIDRDGGIISGGEEACRYSAAFASFIGFGTASVVTDVEEACKGLSVLMEHQTGRAWTIRPEQAGKVAVLRVKIHSYSMKERIHPNFLKK